MLLKRFDIFDVVIVPFLVKQKKSLHSFPYAPARHILSRRTSVWKSSLRLAASKNGRVSHTDRELPSHADIMRYAEDIYAGFPDEKQPSRRKIKMRAALPLTNRCRISFSQPKMHAAMD